MSLPFCNTCWLECRGLGSFEGKATMCDLYEEDQLWTIQEIPGDEGSTRGLHALRNRIPRLKRMLHFVVTREFCRHSPSLRPAIISSIHANPPALISPDDNLQTSIEPATGPPTKPSSPCSSSNHVRHLSIYNWCTSHSFTPFQVLGKMWGNPANPELIQIPAGLLYLVRPDSIKGSRECM